MQRLVLAQRTVELQCDWDAIKFNCYALVVIGGDVKARWTFPRRWIDSNTNRVADCWIHTHRNCRLFSYSNPQSTVAFCYTNIFKSRDKILWHIQSGTNQAMTELIDCKFFSGAASAVPEACDAESLDCPSYTDQVGLEAIRSLHRQLDDDDNGDIDLSESDDVCCCIILPVHDVKYLSFLVSPRGIKIRGRIREAAPRLPLQWRHAHLSERIMGGLAQVWSSQLDARYDLRMAHSERSTATICQFIQETQNHR